MSVFRETIQTLLSKPDVSALMRQGHVQIEEGDRLLISVLRGQLEGRKGKIRLLDIGCGSGFFAKRFMETGHPPDSLEYVAQEEFQDALPFMRERLKDTKIRVFDRPFSEWTDTCDIFLSWGSFHHMSRDHIPRMAERLRPDGVLIVGDEFCPDYLTPEMAERIADAEVIRLAGGFVLTTNAEVEAFERDRSIPDAAHEMERLRRRALWKWYRYAVDIAMERESMEVVDFELRAVRDDLDTACGDEHKLSPAIVARELELAGFRLTAEHVVDPEVEPGLQSFVIQVYGLR